MYKIYLLFLSFWFFSCSVQKEGEEVIYDYIIHNAMILDGSGEEAFPGHVAITGNEIVAVSGEAPDLSSARFTIDAGEKYLTPGFIDLHAHGSPDKTPEFENFLAMGVTTISLGQDGGSPDSEDLKNLLERYETAGLGPNLIMFYGHGTLREESGAGMTDDLDTAAIQKMQNILRQNLQITYGLSMGLEYSPGLYADTTELQMLAQTTGEAGRLIMSHIRNEDDQDLERSLNEMTSLGRYCPVHISHLKSVYGKGEDRAVEILENLKKAKEEGIKVTADIYPYTASYTGIGILFPEWAKTREQFEKALPVRRQELENYLQERVASRNGPAATLIGTGEYAGMTLEEAAAKENVDFTTLLIDYIGPEGASGAYFVMNEALQQRLLEDPLVAICSDGSPTGFHPRGHGTYARIIEEYVKKRQAIQLREAVRKMTAYPADILGLNDRGMIKEGMKADLILFYPDSVRERATYEAPLQLAEGFNMVMVNGKIVRRDGQLTDERPGHYLKPQ